MTYDLWVYEVQAFLLAVQETNQKSVRKCQTYVCYSVHTGRKVCYFAASSSSSNMMYYSDVSLEKKKEREMEVGVYPSG